MVLNFSVNSNQIKTHKQNSDRHFSSHAQLLMCLASNENKMSCWNYLILFSSLKPTLSAIRLEHIDTKKLDVTLIWNALQMSRLVLSNWPPMPCPRNFSPTTKPFEVNTCSTPYFSNKLQFPLNNKSNL